MQSAIKWLKASYLVGAVADGLVGVLMLLGHSSYYFNSIWTQLDPLDPLFGSWGQFALRYMGYICAPGFLMMNGAMVWYSYHRRRAGGTPDAQARWHLIQRGLFLVVVQMLWVNSSWGGFRQLKHQAARQLTVVLHYVTQPANK